MDVGASNRSLVKVVKGRWVAGPLRGVPKVLRSFTGAEQNEHKYCCA